MSYVIITYTQPCTTRVPIVEAFVHNSVSIAVRSTAYLTSVLAYCTCGHHDVLVLMDKCHSEMCSIIAFHEQFCSAQTTMGKLDFLFGAVLAERLLPQGTRPLGQDASL